MPLSPLPERHRAIARVFTRPVFKAIAVQGDAGRAVAELAALGIAPRTPTPLVSDLFEAAHEHLLQNYRRECVYKSALARRFVFEQAAPSACGLVIEQGVANSFVDVALFDGTSTAFEIKTEFDSPRRLVTQTADYLRAFDRVYVVTHPDLAPRYLAHVDTRVGLLALAPGGTFDELRAPVPDTGRIDPLTVFRMLRRKEYMDAVQLHFGEQPELPNGLVYRHHEALFLQLTSAQAHDALMQAFRQRTTDTELAAFVSALPPSLRALGFATPLSRPQRKRMLQALSLRV